MVYQLPPPINPTTVEYRPMSPSSSTSSGSGRAADIDSTTSGGGIKQQNSYLINTNIPLDDIDLQAWDSWTNGTGGSAAAAGGTNAAQN